MSKEEVKGIKSVFMIGIVLLTFVSFLAIPIGIVIMFFNLFQGYLIVAGGCVSGMIFVITISAANDWVMSKGAVPTQDEGGGKK